MDYEKKYKDILSLAKSYKGNDLKEFLDLAFPEHKESKDEKIRKNILTLVKKHAVNHERCQMEAYLEKQKEQNLFHIKDIDYEENLDLAKNAIGMMRDGACYINNRSRKEVLDWLENVPKIIKQLIIKINDLEKHKEQKPAEWSEEDENTRLDIIARLESLSEYETKYLAKAYLQKEISWLKSLRPQPHKWYIKKGHWYMCIVDKPEYGWTKGRVYQSPEDNRIETNYKGSLTNWPNSEPWFRPATRDEIPDSQLHWKPSEEQMDALSDAYVEASTFKMGNILESLYNDLKKL